MTNDEFTEICLEYHIRWTFTPPSLKWTTYCIYIYSVFLVVQFPFNKLTEGTTSLEHDSNGRTK